VRALSCVSVAIALSLGAPSAVADPVVGETSIEVAVGATKSIDVGYARGLQCDDVEVVHAELRGVSPTSNRLFLTGVRVGRTLCRAGTLGAPTVLVHVTVVARDR
jgi:hypothetical protein